MKVKPRVSDFRFVQNLVHRSLGVRVIQINISGKSFILVDNSNWTPWDCQHTLFVLKDDEITMVCWNFEDSWILV